MALGRPDREPKEPIPEAAAISVRQPADSAPAPASPGRIRWAVLLARGAPTRSVGHDVLPLLCPGHRAKRGRGVEMKILAFLTDPPVVSASS